VSNIQEGYLSSVYSVPSASADAAARDACLSTRQNFIFCFKLWFQDHFLSV